MPAKTISRPSAQQTGLRSASATPDSAISRRFDSDDRVEHRFADEPYAVAFLQREGRANLFIRDMHKAVDVDDADFEI